MHDRSRAVAFDLDAVSLASLREALPGWQVSDVQLANAASLSRGWDPGDADLLVVGVRENVRETLGLCRFLAFSTSYSPDFRQEAAGPLGLARGLVSPTRRRNPPLFVLAAPGQEGFVRAALEAGAHSCLILPIHAKEVVRMLAHARAGNQPGRHTLDLEGAQTEDRWRDDGGQG